MATITITIPDAVLSRVLEGMCAAGGWTAESAVPKSAFAKNMIIDYIKATVRRTEDRAASQAAVAAVSDVPGVS